MTPKIGLLQLAPEILIEIFLYLDISDICAIRSTNHFLNSVYRAPPDLQYARECKFSQVLDNPYSHLPVGDRLRMLRDREAAWESLEPTSKRMISPAPSPNLRGVSPAIQRDHYLFYDSSTIQSLPMLESQGDKVRSVLDIDNLVHVYCAIEEHDLIACLTCTNTSGGRVEVQIKLIRYSTGTAHPLAAKPTIVVSTAESLHMVYTASRAMQVFGENLVLGLLRPVVGSDITGKKPFFIPESTSVTVLDEGLFLVPDTVNLSLDIYHIPPSSTGAAVQHICELRLPAVYNFGGTIGFHSIECQSAPNPTGNNEFPKHLPSSVPFIDDPKAALVLVIFKIGVRRRVGTDSNPSSVSMVVHRRSIIDALPPSKRWSTLTTPKDVRWKFWGPSVTHWSSISHAESNSFHNLVYGQRLILPIPLGQANHAEGERAGVFQVKNFNQNHICRAQTEKEYKDFKHKGLQCKPIKNILPFCENLLLNQQKCSGYSITDSLIIGFKETEELANDSGSKKHSMEIMCSGR